MAAFVAQVCKTIGRLSQSRFGHMSALASKTAIPRRRISPLDFATQCCGSDMLSPFAAQEHLMCPIALKHMTDSVVLRGILLAIHFGLAVLPDRCNVTRKCKGAVSLMEYNANDKPSGLMQHVPPSHRREGLGPFGLTSECRIGLHYFTLSPSCSVTYVGLSCLLSFDGSLDCARVASRSGLLRG